MLLIHFTKGSGPNEVKAQGVPRNVFHIGLDRDLAAFDVAFLKRLADHTGLASVFNLSS